jgi:lipid A ethanolaminephosphotransferase
MLSASTAYFMDTFNVIINSDMLLNAVSTDAAESWDLVTPRLIGYLVLLGLLPTALLWRLEIRRSSATQALRSRLKLMSGAALIALTVALASSSFFASFVREHKVLRYYSNPLTPLYALYKFGYGQVAGQSLHRKAIGEDARIPATDFDRELVIMVVGEAARADRFSLNGYSRETNPELAKKGVISFSLVSSCGTSTAISVPCMFAVYERDEFNSQRADSTENFLDVLKHAGVKLLWRDNNSNSKGVANRIPTEDFRSVKVNPICDVECRDEGMLSKLQDYIDAQNSGDILIILHQMGSHGPAYYKRYPPSFRVFTPTCESSQLDACSRERINNSYDNTIVYTDYFLARVVDLLRANDNRFETAMVYVSDHGESLGESGVYLHGLPYWIAPDAQTHVPFILWFGKNYHDVDVDALRELRDLPVSHDNLFHTMLGLFEIRTGVYEEAKDLLQQSRVLYGAAKNHEG